MTTITRNIKKYGTLNKGFCLIFVNEEELIANKLLADS
jgi:hypothetical protein